MGGTKADPTYRDLGDHTETLEIEYDPRRISYEELLEVFWRNHNPLARPYSRQYMAAVFYQDEAQKQLAEESLKRERDGRGAAIFTKVVPDSKFYPAEDYHQKYYVACHPALLREFRAIYPKDKDFVASTAAARVNGFLAGHGTTDTLWLEIDSYGLSTAGKKMLLDIVGGVLRPQCR